MAIRGVDHIDLAVSDVDRSLAFYLGMLGPIGLAVEGRFRTYRGTEDVVYLGFGYEHVPGAQPETRLGLRGADGGEHRYFEVGIEHLAFTVDSRSEVDDAYRRCLSMDARIHFPPDEESDLPGYYAFFVRTSAVRANSAALRASRNYPAAETVSARAHRSRSDAASRSGSARCGGSK